MKGTDEALFGAVAGLFASGLEVARVAGIKTTVAVPDELFSAKVDRSGSHWIWTGFIDRAGYGRWRGGRRQRYSHRVSWEIFHGRPVPAGMQIHHTCGVRSCVNPDHLVAERPRFWPRLSKSPKPPGMEAMSGRNGHGASGSMAGGTAGVKE